MNKKEFKMQLATNPVLSKWMMENMSWLKSRPEVMRYIVQHPNGLQHFRAGYPVDNEILTKNAQRFMNQMMEERTNRKRGKIKTNEKEKSAQQPDRKRKSGGLFGNLKSMFPMFNNLAPAPTSSALPPALRPPGMGMVPFTRPAGMYARPSGMYARPSGMTTQAALKAPKVKRKSPLRLPKLNISRAKLMDTMSQTTEMLDVISALMGKLGNLK